MEKNHDDIDGTGVKQLEDSTACKNSPPTCKNAPPTWYFTAAGVVGAIFAPLPIFGRCLLIPSAYILDDEMGVWLCKRERAKCAERQMMFQEIRNLVAEELARSSDANRCVLFKSDSESVLHLISECPYYHGKE